jgi:NADH-quinone oxidoreductase subunit I
MDVQYELSTQDRFGELLLNKQALAKPNEYYRKIHPTEAGEVDGRLAAEKAKAEAKAKADAELKAKATLAAKPAAAKPSTESAPAPTAVK